MKGSTATAIASVEEYGSLEIERKYLLTGLPSMPSKAKAWMIEQAYLGKLPNGNIAEFMTGEPAKVGGRVRRAISDEGVVVCTHTIKRGSGLVREEYEREITVEQFKKAWKKAKRTRLRKTRFRVRVGDLVWEIDQFTDLELVLAEIELPTEDAEVDMPDWLVEHVDREVTGEDKYANRAIAIRLGKEG